jgi:hypothetical protein
MTPRATFPRQYHVIALAGTHATQSRHATGVGVVRVGLDSGHFPPHIGIRAKVFSVLAAKGVFPSQMATDFYRFAAAAYSADLRIPRESGFDHWSREITLEVPVSDYARWTAAAPMLTDLLAFLTGDRWILVFQVQTVPPPPVTWRRKRGMLPFVPPPAPDIDAVCLLSGGLDSAIGALDAATNRQRLALVSHNAKGDDAFSLRAQSGISAVLRRGFPGRTHHFQFRVDPPRPDALLTVSETSQRSRSLIFLALGITTASGFPAGTPLVVPENGPISLNVPLTSGRLGSWSTRTTHPHTLALARAALIALGIDTPIEAPFRFLTKGEILRDTLDPVRARKISQLTVSCAHPSQFRFEPDPARRRASMPHCGTCFPCLIRRAALARAGWDQDDQYRLDVLRDVNHPVLGRLLRIERGADLRAVRIALARRAANGTGARDLLQSGQLHVRDANELTSLVRVHDAGLAELAAMLEGRSGWDPPATPTHAVDE